MLTAYQECTGPSQRWRDNAAAAAKVAADTDHSLAVHKNRWTR